MKRLFIDTNVILDLLGEREPFYYSAANIFSMADRAEIKLVISALSYSILFYVLSKYEEKQVVVEKLRKLRVLVETAELTEKVIDKSLASNFIDFEDALQYFSALDKKCTLIISRDEKGFKLSDLPVMTPDEYLISLKS